MATKKFPSFISTGSNLLDRLLSGGFPTEGISLVYGKAETGKSSLAIQCAVSAARRGYKSIFVDSEDTFSPIRLSQIAFNDFGEVSPLIILTKPSTFKEQTFVIDHLDEYLTKKVRLLIVDTITALYRTELGDIRKTFALNRELNRQVASLAQIAKSHKLACLLTSQVRGVLTEEQESLEPVATRVLKFWSDIVIFLKRTSRTRIIKVFIEKHPKPTCSASCYVILERTGIRDYVR